MTQANDRRRNRDNGIAGRWAAQHADVRTLGDAVAFMVCSALFVSLGYMALYIGGAL